LFNFAAERIGPRFASKRLDFGSQPNQHLVGRTPVDFPAINIDTALRDELFHSSKGH